MKQYLELIDRVLARGTLKGDRTGTGVMSVFGHDMRFDLSKGFPLLTTKKLHIKSILYELLWILSGDTNIKYLRDNNVTIWDEWADKDGNLGPVYGHQWRHWGDDIDQIENLIEMIRNNPESRRQIVSAWNPSDVDEMKLPPCHMLFQTYVHDGKLSLKLTQRSADIALGVPYNIASYAFLTHMIAQQCDLEVGDLIISLGDAHIYRNHIIGMLDQLERTPKALPTLNIKRKPDSIFDYKFEDFEIVGYVADPSIKFDVAV